MRVLWITLGILTMAQGAWRAQCQPPMPAGQLVREVIYNEQHAHQRHGYWRYWVERRAQGETRLEEQVETADGPIARLALINGRELTPETEQQEQERLEKLLSSHDEQARHSRQRGGLRRWSGTPGAISRWRSGCCSRLWAGRLR